MASGAAAQVPQSAVLAEFRKTKPDVAEIDVIAEQPLIVAVTGKQGTRRVPADWAKGELLGVFARRGDGVVAISMVPNEEGERSVWVDRQEADSVTMALADPDYGVRSDNLKVFFDPKNYFPKRIVRFVPVRVQRIGYVARVLTISGTDGAHEFTAREQRNGAWTVTMKAIPPNSVLPAEIPVSKLEVPAMPVSTVGDVEKARPGKHPTEVGEKIGPFQREGSKIWVGKTFYDGEGVSGIGDIGYYDTAAQTWTFLKIPEMVNWSTSALLVEPGEIWVGLASQGEGAGTSGGLLRYDRATGKAKRFELPEVVLKIARVGQAVYCGTSGGFAVVSRDAVKRFEFVPQGDSSYTVVPESSAALTR